MKKLMMATIIGLILLLIGYGLSVEYKKDQTENITENIEEGSMGIPRKKENNFQTIPPIDAVAPAEFETASFGLG
jgi:hypothetical protein